MYLLLGEIPQQPGVNGAEEGRAIVDGSTHIGDIVDEPAQFDPRKVGGDGEASRATDMFGVVGGAEGVTG